MVGWRRVGLVAITLSMAACAAGERHADAKSSPSAASGTPGANGAVAVAPIGERIDVHGLPVIRLRGTPREMGVQQGSALGAEIKEGFERFIVGYRCHEIRARYEAIAKRVKNEVAFPADVVAEMEGLLEGMRAAGVDLALPKMKREFGMSELAVLNSIDHWGLIGCSGFTAWGSATKDGAVLTARNFDFDVDPEQQAMARLGVIVACEPTGKRPFVSFTFPGVLGVMTGVNDAGVAAFLHVGNGAFGGGEEGQSLPPTLLLRQVLEECSATEAIPTLRERLKSAFVRNSFLFRLVTPGKDSPPTAVFEVDPGAIVEEALPEAGKPPLLLTTNHFLARQDTSTVIPDSTIRWCNLDECETKCLGEGDHVIDAAEAWRGLHTTHQTHGIVTLHAIVLQPATGEIWARFSERDSDSGRVTPAPALAPIHTTFAELLGR